jgi:hypothetical protein
MPLPDAEPPEESRLYEELKSKNALGGATGGNTANLMDALRLATFLDPENEDQLRRILLIGQASGTTSSSGPIPGTGTTAFFEATNSGTRYTIFTPGPGEVWLLGPLSYQTEQSEEYWSVTLRPLRPATQRYTKEVPTLPFMLMKTDISHLRQRARLLKLQCIRI